MEYNLVANLQYCGGIVSEMLGLLMYTQLPAAVVSVFIGLFVAYRARRRSSYLLLAFTVAFALWVIVNFILWIIFDRNTLMITLWALNGILFAWIFFLGHLFVHWYMNEKPMPQWMLALWALAFIPIIVFTPTLLNVSGVDIRDCVAVENAVFTNYYYALGILAMILMVLSSYSALRKGSSKDESARNAKWLVLTGMELFVLAFIATGAVASYLVGAGMIPDFGLEQYGVATMTVFIGILAYSTVKYHAFNLKLLAAQALVFALVILIAAEFLFVRTNINRVLTTITLGIAIVFGYFLVRSVKEEVRQRELIQRQEKELEEVNKQQEGLLHFISHEVKGYLTKNEAGFAAISSGDFGEVPPLLKRMSEEALTDTRKGVETVMDILSAANLQKGTVSYAKKPFDFGKAVEAAVNELKNTADEKGLSFQFINHELKPIIISGDERKMRDNVVRNLVDNAIKYTLSGGVSVDLSRRDGMIRMSVKDSGVGISPEDMQNLFKEGGKGKESVKVNVHSTGYGLFIAKSVVEAHGGKIWAESDGPGKGSRFIVELPTA